MPLGLRLQHLRTDGSDEFIVDYYRDFCKTTVIIQQWTSPNTPEQHGLSKRDRRTVMDEARCLQHGAALLKSLWGEMTATAVMLLNRLLIAKLNDNTRAEVPKTRIKTFTMTDISNATQILGISINQDEERGTLSISQGPYMLSALTGCNPVHTSSIGNKRTAEPEDSVPLRKMETIEYQVIVGSSIFCSSVRVLIPALWCHRQLGSWPSTPVHMGAIKHILRYLCGTPDLHITYSRNSSSELIGFCDASYDTGNPEMPRFASGSIYFLSAEGH